jgi:hypothetical protein
MKLILVLFDDKHSSSEIERVLYHLVQCVLKLGMETF